MKTKIAKEFNWEMSHRLPFHSGLCKNVHGHSYSARVEVEGEPDQNGIVVDYYDLKKLVSPIVEELDHCFLADKTDLAVIEFLEKNGFKKKIFDKYTTAENIAEWFANELKTRLAKECPRAEKLTVRIRETAGVYAEVSLKL